MSGECRGERQHDQKRHHSASMNATTFQHRTNYDGHVCDSQQARLQSQLQHDVAKKAKSPGDIALQHKLTNEYAHPKCGDREFFTLVQRMNQGRGLSDTDKIELLKFLDHCYHNPGAHDMAGKGRVTFRSLEDYKKYKNER